MFDLRDERNSVASVRAAAEAGLAEKAAAITAKEEAQRRAEEDARKARVPQAPSAPDATFLYIVRSGDLVKIGYAANLYIRLSNLRVDNPHGVEMVDCREMSKAMAKDVERFVHRALRAKRASGEWFAVPADEALAHVERVAAIFGDLYGAQM
jgi:hypothetical protein